MITDDTVVLPPTLGTRLLGPFGVVAGGGGMVLLGLSDGMAALFMPAWWVAAGFLAAGVVYSLLRGATYYRLEEEALVRVSPWWGGKRERLRWADLVDMRRRRGVLFLYARGKVRWVVEGVEGLPVLEDIVRRKLGREPASSPSPEPCRRNPL